jgi:small subunit ribosomal protein S6e
LATFKLVISDPKTGKSQHYDLKDSQAQVFIGAKIGDVLDGTVVGIPGKVRITGGSDKSGFPMRKDVQGGVKKYVLLTKGVGFKGALKGEKRRKLVRGNIVTDDIFQINGVIVA